MNQMFNIDADFPGGNILVEEIKDNDVYLRQDLRDTTTFWFYWAFYARSAQGRKLTFHFTSGDVLGVRGPAVSYDDGAFWQWLSDAIVNRDNNKDITFSHKFSPEHTKVLFAFCPVYTQRNLDTLLLDIHKSTFHRRDVLCKSRQGREVELLRLGNPSSPTKVLLTCRHHACEAMASWCLEGILEAVLAYDKPGAWLRANAEFAIIPFIDKDGVEAGDQGKNRGPHDHNRDYGGEISDSIYPEVAAVRRFAPPWWSQGETGIFLDLHCPHIRGNRNEEVYFVGVPNQQVWEEVTAFSMILEKVQKGTVPFSAANNLPFGCDWNTSNNYAAGLASTKWASELPQVQFASAIEIPYANASGAEVTPQSCRALGRDLAAALRKYIEAK
jgi:hypothetical protein